MINPTTLVMFDIDGTLTESSDLDSATFLDALADEFGFHDVSDDWSAYPHATDAGVLAEVFRVRLARPPNLTETRRMQTRYLTLLQARLAARGGLRQILGASEILTRLMHDPAFAVSLASGAWKESARLKLRAAGLNYAGLPSAFSDDDPSREGISRLSHQRAEVQHKAKFSQVVYVGDGVWDVRSSRRLGYRFVGIGQDAGAEKLRAAGAMDILPDFSDAAAFFSTLQAAR